MRYSVVVASASIDFEMGQIVVYKLIASVVTFPSLEGQSVIEAAQEVTV